MTDYVVVDTDEPFIDACRILSGGSGPVAVDVEPPPDSATRSAPISSRCSAAAPARS